MTSATKKEPFTIPLYSFSDDDYGHIAPFSLLLLGSQLRKHGYQPQLNHLLSSQIDLDKIVDQLEGVPMVGISVFTGPYLETALEISREAKAKYGEQLAVVWGGIHPSLCPELTLKEEFIDYIVVGEGEESIWQLADYITGQADSSNLSNISGLGYKKSGEMVFNEKKLLTNIDEYDYAWDLVDIERYIHPMHRFNRAIDYFSSRGCPFNCSFCYNLVFNDRKWRGRDPERVIKDINHLKTTYEIDAIHFYDDYFFGNKKRAELIVKSVDLPWFAEMVARDFSPKRVKKLKSLGAFGFFCGAESGSPKILASLNKRLSPQDIVNAGKICKQEGIEQLRFSFILFTPDETINDVRMTVKVILQLIRKNPTVTIGIGHYTPYPRVEIVNKLKEMGWDEPTSTKEWANYNRQIRPETLGIFSEKQVADTLELKEAVMSAIGLYKSLSRYGVLGAVLLITISRIGFISDLLFSKGFLKLPFETRLIKLLRKIKSTAERMLIVNRGNPSKKAL